MLELTAGDNARRIELALHAGFTVKLPENPTTGYRWAVETADGLRLISSRYEAGGAIGAAGLRCFDFQAVRAGAGRLRLVNRREWEPGVPPTATYEIAAQVG